MLFEDVIIFQEEFFMGAWGLGSFENDTALDWVFDLTEGGLDLIEQALDVVPGLQLDADEGSQALAAAEIVAALNGRGRGNLPEEVTAWMASVQPMDAQPLRAKALQALDAVLSEESELRELWAETEDFEAWKADVEALKTLLG